jgi:hypothetical protein
MDIRHLCAAGLCVAALSACSSPPDVEAALGPEPEGTTYPSLLPIEDVLEGTAPDTTTEDEAQAALDARVSALKSRAAALRRIKTP